MATRRGTTNKKPTAAKEGWPLGEFLKQQREGMSIREAARRANISESRWRQVELGVQRMAGGIEVPVHPRPETVVAMCSAISADQREGLRLAGYNPSHYEFLIYEQSRMPANVGRDWFAKLPREEREKVLAELQRLHVDVELKRRRAV